MNSKNLSRLILGLSLIAGGASAVPTTATTSNLSSVILVPEEIVYTSELPSVTDLTEGAALQGVTISQIASSPLQTTVVYGYPNGKTKVVAYQLPPPESEDSALPAASSPRPEGGHEVAPAHHLPRPLYPKKGDAPVSFHFGFVSPINNQG